MDIRARRWMAVFAVAWMFWGSGCFISRDVAPGVELEALVASQFNHRGMVQNEEAVAQGALRSTLATIDGGQILVSAWGNLDLRNATGDSWFSDNNGGRFSEVDFVAAYSRTIQAFTLSAGVTNYVLPDGTLFPNGPRGSTTELFAVAQMDVAGFVPEVALHFDVDEADGFYGTLGVSRRFQLSEQFGLNLEARLGVTDGDHADWAYATDESGFSDLRGTAEVDFRFDDRTTLFAGIGGSTIVDSDLEDWFDTIEIDADNVWVAGGVRFRF